MFFGDAMKQTMTQRQTYRVFSTYITMFVSVHCSKFWVWMCMHFCILLRHRYTKSYINRQKQQHLCWFMGQCNCKLLKKQNMTNYTSLYFSKICFLHNQEIKQTQKQNRSLSSEMDGGQTEEVSASCDTSHCMLAPYHATQTAVYLASCVMYTIFCITPDN